MAFVMNSPAFEDGHEMPRKYAKDGENVSPPLEWRDPPPGTKSYALIVEDPDAPSGTFRHWAIYDIAGGRTMLPEGVDSGAKAERMGRGVNDFGSRRYDGPRPPSGDLPHHYHFRLAALDVEALDLPLDASVEDVWKAAQRHKIGETELVGVYKR